MAKNTGDLMKFPGFLAIFTVVSKLDCRMLCVPAAFCTIALSITDKIGETPNVIETATRISPVNLKARSESYENEGIWISDLSACGILILEELTKTPDAS
jgi:hypothetical protein